MWGVGEEEGKGGGGSASVRKWPFYFKVKQGHSVRSAYNNDGDCFYLALFSALEQTQCTH